MSKLNIQPEELKEGDVFYVTDLKMQKYLAKKSMMIEMLDIGAGKIWDYVDSYDRKTFLGKLEKASDYKRIIKIQFLNKLRSLFFTIEKEKLDKISMSYFYDSHKITIHKIPNED